MKSSFISRWGLAMFFAGLGQAVGYRVFRVWPERSLPTPLDISNYLSITVFCAFFAGLVGFAISSLVNESKMSKRSRVVFIWMAAMVGLIIFMISNVLITGISITYGLRR